MKLVKNTKLFVDLTNIMVVHIINNKIGCFDHFVLTEYGVTSSVVLSFPPEQSSTMTSNRTISETEHCHHHSIT